MNSNSPTSAFVNRGLITCSTNNIGDDIQSLAVSLMMPEPDFAIDREKISQVRLASKAVIAGWYKHDETDWPPAPALHPLFVSFHAFRSRCVTRHLDYFARAGRIGCRDLATVDLLKGYGIDAYFSGCVTLTLPELHAEEPTDLPLFVDLDAPSGIDHVRRSTFISEMNPGKRLVLADKRLQEIAAARCVVTNRLHTALPAAAMNIPVLLIPPAGDPRFSGLLQFVNSAESYDEDIIRDFIANPKPNPNAELRNSMAESIRSRIAEFFVDDQPYVPMDTVPPEQKTWSIPAIPQRASHPTHNGQPGIDLGVVTLWTPEINDWAERQSAEKIRYCAHWGFSYHPYPKKIESSRAPTWSKIPALINHLNDHDWLLWVDADAVITNHLFDARTLCDPEADLVITHDHAGFNAGIFLIRNTEVARRFLDRVWQNDIDTFHFEQTSMDEIMASMPDLRVKILPKRSMNSYWFDHRPGDFIFHAAGESSDMKTKLLTVFANAARLPDPLAHTCTHSNCGHATHHS